MVCEKNLVQNSSFLNDKLHSAWFLTEQSKKLCDAQHILCGEPKPVPVVNSSYWA
jgi:hypothetical protein